jgi:OHCU decarboxylase
VGKGGAVTARVAGYLNALSEERARTALQRCCGARHWVDGMLAARPFASDAELLAAAERVWWGLGRADWLEAFAAHPRIGARAEAMTDWARREQAGANGAAEATLAALAQGNRTYEERFGHVFLICATGRTADEMLGALRGRLTNDPATELRVAAEEQAKITRLRLDRLAVS